MMSVTERAGTGPTLVLLHGFTDCAPSFRLLLPHLGDCHVVIPDLRNHGGTFRDPGLGLADFAGDIASLLQVMGLRKVSLVGHSMGALIAMTLASDRTQPVEGLVLISGSLRPAGPAMTQLKARISGLPEPLTPADAFFAEWHRCEAPLPEGFSQQLAQSACAMHRGDWMAMLETLEDADLTEVAARLHVPVLALSGARDPIFPHSHHRHLAETLAPQGRQHWADCGHNPHWDHPERVGMEILRFAQASPAGRAVTMGAG